MENIFGEIQNGKMILDDVGKIVEHWINETKNKFPNIKMNISQVMPNHVHLIIIIVGAGFSRPTQTPNKLPTLGQIIAYFKYQTTIAINNLNMESGAKTAPLQNKLKYKKFFQRNYYEHIIRDEKDYYKIRQYIINNPRNWGVDENNV